MSLIIIPNMKAWKLSVLELPFPLIWFWDEGYAEAMKAETMLSLGLSPVLIPYSRCASQATWEITEPLGDAASLSLL